MNQIQLAKISILQQPSSAKAYLQLAALFKKENQKDSYFYSHKFAKDNNPEDLKILIAAGIAGVEAEKFNEAKSLFQEAAKKEDKNYLAWFYLGLCLFAQKKYAKSLQMFYLSTQLNPIHLGTLTNIGVLFQLNNLPHKAACCYKIALQIEPKNAGLNYNLATALLSSGQYVEGWKHFRWRFQNPSTSAIHALPSGKEWRGEKLKIGQRVGVISEQGLGDTIQFIRYCKTLKERGMPIQCFIQKPLVDLVRESGIDAECQQNTNAESSDIDTWIPLMSIPEILGVTPNNPIISSTYIKTREDLINKWSNQLNSPDKLTIGIKWQGFQGNERLFNQSIGRSLPLSKFKLIADNFNVEFVSLQKDEGSEQISNCGFEEKFTPHLQSVEEERCMLETAAIIMSCDLILTCDSVIAHLSGALGAPTWLLLNSCPEWRWGHAGKTTFWYPNTRLFRQKNQGNWDDVVQNIAKEMTHFIKA